MMIFSYRTTYTHTPTVPTSHLHLLSHTWLLLNISLYSLQKPGRSRPPVSLQPKPNPTLPTPPYPLSLYPLQNKGRTRPSDPFQNWSQIDRSRNGFGRHAMCISFLERSWYFLFVYRCFGDHRRVSHTHRDPYPLFNHREGFITYRWWKLFGT